MTEAHTVYDEVESIKNFILKKSLIRPTIGIICGTGLGSLADTLEEKDELAYQDIPGFPLSTVAGHAGKLVLGKLSGKEVVCMQGRFHLYEGHSVWKVVLPVRVLCMLGIKTLFVTNAAGGINRSYNVGDIMVIKDHINFTGMAGFNPLVGLNEERFGPRFPNMTNAYDPSLRKLAHSIAEDLKYQSFIREGVYAMICGPSFETQAELRFLQIGGADVVGMSTCPEVTVARHHGVKVFGLTLVSNLGVMTYDDDVNGVPTHEEVLETGKTRSEAIKKLVTKMVEEI